MATPLAAGGFLLCQMLLQIQVLSLTSYCYLDAYLMKAGHWKAIPPSISLTSVPKPLYAVNYELKCFVKKYSTEILTDAT